MIILACKGDHNWRYMFEKAEEAYWFLYSIVSNRERFYSAENEWPEYHTYNMFDLEDDCILWKEGDIVRYAPGWHWGNHLQDPQIVMPDGHEFTEIFRRYY